MGVWGPGIFEDDIAADVRDEYLELLAGSDQQHATQQLLTRYEDALADRDDGRVVWLALAATQLEHGRVEPNVAAQALAVMDANLEYWRQESSPDDASAREVVLNDLRSRLESPTT